MRLSLIEELLGPNWRTTTSGFIANCFSYAIIVILAIAQNPKEFNDLWLPTTPRAQALAIITFLGFLAKTYRDWQMKDKVVAGGRIIQNAAETIIDKKPKVTN